MLEAPVIAILVLVPSVKWQCNVLLPGVSQSPVGKNEIVCSTLSQVAFAQYCDLAPLTCPMTTVCFVECLLGKLENSTAPCNAPPIPDTAAELLQLSHGILFAQFSNIAASAS